MSFLAKARLEDYEEQEKLGQGTYGVVTKCRNKKTGEQVAVKKILRKDDKSTTAKSVMTSAMVRELSLLQELKHKNIVELQGIIREETQFYLIFEYLSMDLYKYMKNIHKGAHLPKPLVHSFLCQILNGMSFSHSRNILHRDLKPENILVDAENGVIKVADFGFARTIHDSKRTYSPGIVSLQFRAPEIFLGVENYSFGVDMWSIGCIFAEMAKGTMLFRGKEDVELLLRIFEMFGTPTEETWPGVTELKKFQINPPNPNYTGNNLVATMDSKLDETGLDLLQKMLVYDPNKRISAKEALQHTYITRPFKGKAFNVPTRFDENGKPI